MIALKSIFNFQNLKYFLTNISKYPHENTFPCKRKTRFNGMKMRLIVISFCFLAFIASFLLWTWTKKEKEAKNFNNIFARIHLYAECPLYGSMSVFACTSSQYEVACITVNVCSGKEGLWEHTKLNISQCERKREKKL